MKIALGNDHVGYEMKKVIAAHLVEQGYEVVDFGCDSNLSVDYPIYGKKVADAVASKNCDKGILICGTGIGISLAANKVKGIRAACCSDPVSAELSRRHNDANILAFGARIIANDIAIRLTDVFLTTEFEGGRHERRVKLLTDIENHDL